MKTNRRQSIFVEALLERPAHLQLVIVLCSILVGIALFSSLTLFYGQSIDRASLLAGMFAIVIAALAAFVPKKPKPMKPEEIARLQAPGGEGSGQLDGILSAEQSLVLRIIGDYEYKLLKLEERAAKAELSDEAAACMLNARNIVEALKFRAREIQRIRSIKSVKRAIKAHKRLGDELQLSSSSKVRLLRRRSGAALPRSEWEQVLSYLLGRCENDLAKSAAA
ncbi:MAG: hypothetical protein KDD66_10935 [Bdellovibrionales bacterium]|nr:hypothetical protein [Bdellovibrionales bacterium]